MLETIPDNYIAASFVGLWCFIWIVSTYAVAAKRLHDLNYSGLWVLAAIAVLTLVSLAFRGQDQIATLLFGAGFIWLGMAKGNKGANRFGGEPPSSGELPTIGDRELVPQ